MVWRLEIAAADDRIEIPARELYARHDLDTRARGNELGERRRVERSHGLDSRGKAERLERIPPSASDLDREAAEIEADPARDVDLLSDRTGESQRGLRVLPPHRLGARGESERERESRHAVRLHAPAVVPVEGLADASGQRERCDRHPTRTRFELPRKSRAAQAPDRRHTRMPPHLAELEIRARQRAIRDERVVADAAARQRRRHAPPQSVVPLGEEDLEQPIASILPPAVDVPIG